jgi:2-haloacid dehalogenase
MLAAAVDSAALNPYFDALLSVEAVGVFKPHPSVYQMAPDQLGVRAEQICYVSANGWDAYSAKAFGMRVAWCNRFGQAPERIPTAPDVQMMTLAELPGLLGH